MSDYSPTAGELTRPCADPVKAALIREYVRIVRSTGGRNRLSDACLGLGWPLPRPSRKAEAKDP